MMWRQSNTIKMPLAKYCPPLCVQSNYILNIVQDDWRKSVGLVIVPITFSIPRRKSLHCFKRHFIHHKCFPQYIDWLEFGHLLTKQDWVARQNPMCIVFHSLQLNVYEGKNCKANEGRAVENELQICMSCLLVLGQTLDMNHISSLLSLNAISSRKVYI